MCVWCLGGDGGGDAWWARGRIVFSGDDGADENGDEKFDENEAIDENDGVRVCWCVLRDIEVDMAREGRS